MRNAELSPNERDVLLYSSGELAWWKRRSLARRLCADADAQRLAESLTLTTLLAKAQVRHPARSRPRVIATWTAVAASLAIGVGWWQISRVRRSADDSAIAVVWVRAMTATPEPLHRTGARLRLRLSAHPGGDAGVVRVTGLLALEGEPPSWSGIPVEVSAAWLASTEGGEPR